MKPVGTVTWLPGGERQEAFEELTLTAHAMMIERRHHQACGGQAECGTCRVRVISGEDHLTPPPPDELELRAEHPGALAEDERLACRCRPTGDVVVETPRRRPKDLRFARTP